MIIMEPTLGPAAVFPVSAIILWSKPLLNIENLFRMIPTYHTMIDLLKNI